MKLLSSNQLLKYLNNIIHEDTQLHNNSIDLTVNSVHKFTKAGSLDFGGSEFEPAKTKPINPEKKNPDDDYGWWNLKAGTYRIEFNEQLKLDENTLAFIVLHAHARKAGLLGDLQAISRHDEPDMVFKVPDTGCNIKENARFATLYLMQE